VSQYRLSQHSLNVPSLGKSSVVESAKVFMVARGNVRGGLDRPVDTATVRQLRNLHLVALVLEVPERTQCVIVDAVQKNAQVVATKVRKADQSVIVAQAVVSYVGTYIGFIVAAAVKAPALRKLLPSQLEKAQARIKLLV